LVSGGEKGWVGYAIVNGKRDNAVECTTSEYIKVVQYFEKVAFRGSVVTR